jgi:hypothetical protein
MFQTYSGAQLNKLEILTAEDKYKFRIPFHALQNAQIIAEIKFNKFRFKGQNIRLRLENSTQ